jgi:hypothetical protein
MLDRMELGAEAVVVVHVGGTYGYRASSKCALGGDVEDIAGTFAAAACSGAR